MKHTGDYELDEINMLEQECADLEEENKRLEEENKKLKDELKKTNELLSNAARCAEQYRGKMISVMGELKMFLYKD